MVFTLYIKKIIAECKEAGHEPMVVGSCLGRQGLRVEGMRFFFLIRGFKKVKEKSYLHTKCSQNISYKYGEEREVN